jgi:PIN domain nuclease of toxin-antitoxin system
VKLLLDTHIFLWFISGDAKLPHAEREAICDPTNEVFLSVIAIWEATVKYQLGKLPLPQPPEIYLPGQRERHGISSLALDERSVSRLGALPLHHRDPFDRMMICQAIEHGMSFITVDPVIAKYPVARFGASV